MKTTYKNFKITSTFLGDKAWNADEKNTNYNNHLVTVVNTETHKKTAFEFWGSIMHQSKQRQLKRKQGRQGRMNRKKKQRGQWN